MIQFIIKAIQSLDEKRLKNVYFFILQKKIFAFFAALILLLSLGACSSDDAVDSKQPTDPPAQNTDSRFSPTFHRRKRQIQRLHIPQVRFRWKAKKPPEGGETVLAVAPSGPVSGTLGDYDVSVVSHRLSKDYKDAPAIIVTFGFTNNGDDSSNFLTAISCKAFQDGVQLSYVPLIA